MKRLSSFVKSILSTLKKNYLVFVFILVVFFVGIIFLYKLSKDEDTVIYAKVKVSQGYWWANTAKPSIWLVQSLKKSQIERAVSGESIVEIMEVTHYPSPSALSIEYDVYLHLKLKVTQNPRTKQYLFKRESIGIGAPIELDFPETQVNAFIIEMSKKPIQSMYIEKVVTIEKNFIDPTEYETIKVGDIYFDGKSTVVEVLDKTASDSYEVYSSSNNNYPINTKLPLNAIITLKMKLKRSGEHVIYREEVPLILGKRISFFTSHYFFENYLVADIK